MSSTSSLPEVMSSFSRWAWTWNQNGRRDHREAVPCCWGEKGREMSGSGKGRVCKPYLFRCLTDEPSFCRALPLLVFPSLDQRAMNIHTTTSIFGFSSVFEKVLSCPCWLPAQYIESGFEFLTILPQLPSAEIAGSPGHLTPLPVLIRDSVRSLLTLQIQNSWILSHRRAAQL